MFEAYSVAVRVSLVNNVTSGLLGISRAFGRVHGDAKALRAELSAIKLTMLTGGAIAGVGFLGLAAIGKTVEPAREYAHQLAQMNIAGMKHAEVVRSINAAWEASRTVPTSTATQNLAAIRELRMVFGDTTHAIENMPTVQRLQYILANTADKRGSTGANEAYTVAKALEMKGAVQNPATFNLQADMMAKAIVASGGKIGASDFLSTFKYGRVATRQWSSEFAYTILPTLIQEMKSGGSGGAGGPGNALMSAYATVVGGTIAQKNIGLWQKLGLLDPSKIVTNKVGSTKGIAPGGVMGTALFQENPYRWTQEVLVPALNRAGIRDPKERQQVLSRLFANRTAGAVMSQMAMQSWMFERDRRMIGIARGLGSYNELMKSDPNAAQAALAAQWKNLLTVIGYEILPIVVSGTLRLIDGLRGLTKAMREHPTLTKALVLGFAALSASLAFSGLVLLLNGAIRGLALTFRLFSAAAAIPSLITGLRTLMASEIAVLGVTSTLGASLTSAAGGLIAFAGGVATLLGVIAGPAALLVLGERAQQKREAAILADPSAASPIDRALLARKYRQEAGVRQLFGVKGAEAYSQSADRVSPYVKPRPQIEWGKGPGTVYLDGRKVGEIVSDQQAKALGLGRVVAGRHDPSVTPAAAAGVQRR